MNALAGSKRTRVVFWLFSAVLVVSVALVIALLVSLGGYFIAGWQGAPVPQIIGWLVRAVVPLVLLRLALAWSMHRDRRNRT